MIAMISSVMPRHRSKLLVAHCASLATEVESNTRALVGAVGMLILGTALVVFINEAVPHASHLLCTTLSYGGGKSFSALLINSLGLLLCRGYVQLE